jgi:hypothetical protein
MLRGKGRIAPCTTSVPRRSLLILSPAGGLDPAEVEDVVDQGENCRPPTEVPEELFPLLRRTAGKRQRIDGR